MRTVISLLHEGPDATDELERKLRTLVVASECAALVARVPNPALELASKISEALDSPLGEVVNAVWADHHDVRVAIEQTRSAPAAPVQIPLVHERVTVTDTLRVDVDGFEQSKLEPTLTVALDIRTLTVTVQGGRVTEVGPLDADVTAQLKLGDRELLTGSRTAVKLRGRKLAVPPADSIDLRDPVAGVAGG